MTKYKTVSIPAILVVFVLFFFINNSEAATITYLYVSADTDYGSGGNFSASLSADEDIDYIDWYVKLTYPIAEGEEAPDYTHVLTSMHNGTNSVYVDLGAFDGNIKIAGYDIKAVVSFPGGSDTNTTSTCVYKPVIDDDYKGGFDGHAELTAHYYDGSYIVMSGFVSVYNGSGNDARGSGRFKHVNQWFDELEKDLPSKTFASGQTYSYSTGDWGSYFNFFAGDLENADDWICSAYIRVKVEQEESFSWFASDSNTFNSSDVQ